MAAMTGSGMEWAVVAAVSLAALLATVARKRGVARSALKNVTSSQRPTLALAASAAHKGLVVC